MLTIYFMFLNISQKNLSARFPPKKHVPYYTPTRFNLVLHVLIGLKKMVSIQNLPVVGKVSKEQ